MEYSLQVLRGREGLSTIRMDALSESDATRMAASQGYTVVAVRPVRHWAGQWRSSRFPLAAFSSELLALLKAGLGLVEALQALSEREESPELSQVLAALVARLQEGQPFSAALEGWPRIFPALYVATIRAAERTSDIQAALSRYIRYQSQVETIRKKVLSAAIYPAVLLVVGGGVIIFLMAYVVPRFSVIYESSRGELPWMSALLLQWGRLLSDHAGTALVIALAMVLGAIYLLSQESVRQGLLRVLWRVPALGARMRLFRLSGIYRTLGMLLSGGIPIVTAGRMTVGSVGGVFRDPLERALQRISEGQSISRALTDHDLTTPVTSRLLRVGEQTGNMGAAMDSAAEFIEEELARWIDWFSRLFEPVLMTVIGVLVGVVVVLMYVPIFELVGSFQ
jgi:general secretion pathway protein F